MKRSHSGNMLLSLPLDPVFIAGKKMAYHGYRHRA
jgi:hypothetical protein